MKAATGLALLASCALLLTGCATPYTPRRLNLPGELRDVQARTVSDVTVSVSLLTDEEARQHFGADLGKHELQALWMSVHNATERRLWFLRNVLDPDFYSAEEAALLVQKDAPRDARSQVHQYFRDESIRVLLVPWTTTEGFVFLPRVEGGRYIDIRLQGDAYTEAGSSAREAVGSADVAMPPPRELRFEFALTLPDGDFDYERLDPSRTYAGLTLPELALDDLRMTLEGLPCCTTDAQGAGEGDPLNVVLIGDSSEVLNSLTRSGWSFTHRITLRSVGREIGAAIEGKPYAVAPVSNLYLFGRRHDLALQRARRSIAQRNHMRLWLAPFRLEDRPVWVGQVSRDIGVKITTRSPTLTTHIIDPQVDATREYLLHSLIAQGFVDRFGFVKGSARAEADQPGRNLTGDPYISDGMRLVILLAEEPVAPDRVESLRWEQSAPPIAEGQSESSRRNVRPIESNK